MNVQAHARGRLTGLSNEAPALRDGRGLDHTRLVFACAQTAYDRANFWSVKFCA
jgi:hypothetical protein